MKRVIIAALALLLLCAAPALSEGLLGQPFPDFTVTTTDGETFTLSEALRDRDMVLINVFATWCGPCRSEFPAMREAYEAYADRVAVIVLSGDSDDTLEALTEYRAENDLPMPFAREEGTGINDFIGLTAFPTSVAVDRFGNISMISVGAVTDAARFKALFKALTADDYAETVTFDEMPAAEMDVEYPDPAALSAALNAEGGQLAFYSDPEGKDYPFAPVELGERQAVAATNADRANSASRVGVRVSAQAGDALAFDFVCGTGIGYGYMAVEIDGEVVKKFGGSHDDWGTWTLPLTEGEHAVDFCYHAVMEYEGEAAALLDNVRVLSGDAAAAALAEIPAYPVGERFDVRATDDGARPGRYTLNGDDIGLNFWVVNGDSAHFEIELAADMDPETAVFYDVYHDAVFAVADLLTASGDAYAYDLALDGDEETPFGAVNGYSNLFSADGEEYAAYVFSNADDIQMIIDYYAGGGYQLQWEYTD